jgi:hypothetical protein
MKEDVKKQTNVLDRLGKIEREILRFFRILITATTMVA